MTRAAGPGLQQAATWLGCPPPAADGEIGAAVIDSREVAPGDLFVALPGRHADGHDFVADAAARGAIAALVARPCAIALPQLVVADPERALQQLATQWRQQFSAPLLAVAGSNGKTTTREMLGAILRCHFGQVLVTRGNRNNALGVPLTLLGLRATHGAAVLELGANHPGEIGLLARLARPTLGLITNSGLDHLAGFGSREGAALANAELFQGLRPGAPVVLNADDECFGLWKARCQGRQHWIGCSLEGSPDAAVRGRWRARREGGELEVDSPLGEVHLRLQLPGRHNGANALLATAAALACGIAPAAIATGLAGLAPVPGRLARTTLGNGACLIDDSYNANPSSLAAALAVLAELPGKRLLLLGDMGELGPAAEALHAAAGSAARAAGLGELHACGPLAALAARAFGPGGHVHASPEAAATAIAARMGPTHTVLVKGSRSARLERAVALLATPGSPGSRGASSPAVDPGAGEPAAPPPGRGAGEPPRPTA